MTCHRRADADKTGDDRAARDPRDPHRMVLIDNAGALAGKHGRRRALLQTRARSQVTVVIWAIILVA